MRTSVCFAPTLPLLVALVGATACFHYEPLNSQSPGTGATIRVHLTNAGAAGLVSVLGPEARVVDGVLVGLPDSAYLVAVSAVTRDGARIAWAGEQVSLHRDVVAFIEQRTVDVRRSAVAVGTTIAAVVLSARLARNAGGGASGPDGGGIPAP